MRRNQFRSQPTLQRTSAHGPSWILGAGLAVVTAFAVMVTFEVRQLPPPAPAAPRIVEAPPPADAPTDAPASALLADAGAPLAMTPVAAPVPVVAPAARVGEKAQARPKARRSQVARAPAAQDAAEPAVAAVDWKRQQDDYREAMARYDANERDAGYRWAKDNRVRFARFCRTSGRTDAFMQGCLSYLGRNAGKPREAPA